MVVLSKVFEQCVSTLTCTELLHPPHSCLKSTFVHMPRFFWSNAKFYWPMLPLQVLMKVRSVEMFWKVFQYYLQLCFGGFFVSYTTKLAMCVCRQILGKFNYWTILFLPSVLGNALSALFDPRVKHLQHTGIYQALIESVLIQRGNRVTRAIGDSALLQTLIFMSCSVLIMDAKQRYKHKDFWFLQAEQHNKTADESTQTSVCSQHAKLGCTLHILQGMRNYFAIGLLLDIFKMLISAPRGKFKLNSTGLLAGYMGIYRATHCLLNRYRPQQQTFNHCLAAFLGGAAFGFFPKLTILSYALLQAWQILLKYHLQWRPKSFSFDNILYPLANAYLIHTYVFQPKHVSTLAARFIDGCTANYASDINKRLQHVVDF